MSTDQETRPVPGMAGMAEAAGKLRRFLPREDWRNPPPIVSVLRLAGTLYASGRGHVGLSIQGMDKAIDRAFRQPRLVAVALAINSPGGSAVQASLIAGRIRALATEKKIPVLAFVEDAAASGGYWLACAGDEIHADASSIVGSIGVIAEGFGLKGLLERIGGERRVHKAGAMKDMLDPFQDEKPDHVEKLNAALQDIHTSFKDYVRDRRAGKLHGLEDNLFTGAFWTGRQALDLGLVDGLGDMRQIVRARFGERVKFVEIERRRSWLAKKLETAGPAPAGRLVEQAIAGIENRLLWSRFGL